MLSIVMLSVIMLTVVSSKNIFTAMLGVIMLSVIMLVIASKKHFYCYDGCRYAQCHYTERCGATFWLKPSTKTYCWWAAFNPFVEISTSSLH